jgi:2-polyprenyl-3-methyl-5-hydroxy-6-metoxy-1,4-benzoquinol methylase
MYQDFVQRLAEYKQLSVAELTDSTRSDHRYALTCRDRGNSYVSRLGRLLHDDIADIRLLDVGCAYGGISIALALAGARAAGVEVVPSYVDLARRNAQGETDVEFFHGDLTLKTTMLAVRAGKVQSFNVFVINHVLEHIYDTEGLLQNLDALATDDAVILFDVPNGFSITSYMAEGHTNVFGVSLADPDTWHFFGNPRARIYYRRLEYFRALFAAHGYAVSLARPPRKSREEMERALVQAIEASKLKAAESPAPAAVLQEAMARFESEVAHDLAHADDDTLDLKFFNYFWRGIAYRPGARVREGMAADFPFAAWGDD